MSTDQSVHDEAADEAEDEAADEAAEESFPASDPPASWAGSPSGYSDMPSSSVRGARPDDGDKGEDEPDEDEASEPRPFMPPALDPESP
jgi:hypothetical protein